MDFILPTDNSYVPFTGGTSNTLVQGLSITSLSHVTTPTTTLYYANNAPEAALCNQNNESNPYYNMAEATVKFNSACYPGTFSSNWATDYCSDLINPYQSSNNPWFVSSSKLALHQSPNIDSNAFFSSNMDFYSSKQLLNEAVALQNATTSELLDSNQYSISNTNTNDANALSVQSYAAQGFNLFSEVANSLFGQ